MSVSIQVGADQIVERLSEAIRLRNVAHLVLTGGRGGALLTQAVASQRGISWQQVHIWWSDERIVAADDPDRNDGQVASALLKMNGAILHRMPAAGMPNPANQYQQELNSNLGICPFDVVMLGVGEDGHVASLFPERFNPEDAAMVREVDQSPKPPAHRLTLTLPRLNNCRHLFLIFAGAGKSAVLSAAQRQDKGLPVGHVWGMESTTFVVSEDVRG